MVALAQSYPHGVLDEALYTPHFARIGVQDIPRDVVACLQVDAQGFLWIGGGDGLIRYDGRRYEPITLWNGPNGGNIGWVRAMQAGPDGRVWIASEIQGLLVFDPVSGKVQTTLASMAPGQRSAIVALALDGEGTLWIGQDGGGLSSLDTHHPRLQRYATGPGRGQLPDPHVRALLVDRQGALWVGTRTGVQRLRQGSPVFEAVAWPAAGPGPGSVTALAEARDGTVLAGMGHGGVLLMPPKGAAAHWLTGGPPAQRAAGSVTSMLPVDEHQVWVGRRNGISIYTRGDPALPFELQQHLAHDPRRLEGLPADEISTLTRDAQGRIWVGGFGTGLLRHDPTNQSLWVRGADLDPRSPVADPDLRALLEQPAGTVWAAPHAGQLLQLGPDLRVRRQVRLPADGSPTGPSPLSALTRASDEGVWAANDSQIYRLDRQGRVLWRHVHGLGFVRRLWAQADDTLWLATLDGLYRWPRRAAAPERLHLSTGQRSEGEINALTPGPDGRLWVGSDRGLFTVRPEGAALLEPVRMDPAHGLASPVVLELLFDHANRLWVDTAMAGLHRAKDWQAARLQFDPVSERHGRSGRPFGANLMEDALGRLWTHMHVYDPATDRMEVLNEAQGATQGTGWFYARAALHDGRMLIGGSKGLLVIHPARHTMDQPLPPISLSGLRLGDGEWRPVTALQQIVIPRETPALEASFALLNGPTRPTLRLAYRLKGWDKTWNRASTLSQQVSYSHLPGGNYVLQVRALDSERPGEIRTLDLPVQVPKAWWERWWGRALQGAGVLALLFALLQWRTTRLRQRQAELEDKVRSRTAELEQASRTDALTGLRNRQHLSEDIQKEISLSRRRHDSRQRTGTAPLPLMDDADLVLFLIDLDHFKQVNDLHGHAAGDAVLRQIADRLRLVFRDSDLLVRWGGEEFLVVARQTDRRHAAVLAERLRAVVATTPFLLPGGGMLARTCSVGFCSFPPDPTRPDLLDWPACLHIADEALLRVKRQQRNAWLGLTQVDLTPPRQAQMAHSPVETIGSPGCVWEQGPA